MWLAMPVLAADLASDARDILARRCSMCHSAQVKTAGLDLSSRAAAQRVLQPGNSALLARVTQGQMPPGKPLPPEEVETLQRWVKAGAPWTGGRDWWSLQPLRTVPDHGIDHWVRAKLRAEGLEPAPSANRRTLIRRVTFDLVGLPPTPEEIAAFERDQRPDAYERLVDRLLASPRYGEQWARHWLDVVRYSESEGFERDWLRDHAWPYRDYVIRSFNDDKPYGQFVREQIAGDVIEPVTHDSLTATAFLVLGPYDAVGLTSAVGAERAQVRADQMEELVGTVSQTFLGLTVNCARCHDHKFDPIPQRDYYRLKAVFDGIWQPTVGEELKADGRYLLTPGELGEREARLGVLRGRVRDLEARLGALDRVGRGRAPGARAQWTFDTDTRDEFGSLHGAAEKFELRDGRLVSGTVSTSALEADVREKTLEAWVFAKTAPDKGATLLRIRNRSGFRGAAYDGIRYTGGKNKQWENMSTVNFRTAEVAGVLEDTAAGGRVHIAITYSGTGEIRLYRNGQPYGKPYTPDGSAGHGRLQTYGKGDAVVELTAANGLELEEARLYSRTLTAEEIAASYAAGVVNLAPVQSEERERLARELAEARAELGKTGEPARVWAATVQPGEPTRLLLRGDVNKPGEVVTPAAPSCLNGELELASDAPDAERRKRLAEWITNPANPLFSRVIVNRIWHYHFGAGLVESPNDFGFNGGHPSHPELLDWLAAEFVRGGGSIKRLHKLIVMSETYRQSSRFDSTAAAKDAGARLLWRFPPQRLSGEAVRDAMLSASGALNTQMYGPSFRAFQVVKNAGSYHSYEPIDSSAPEFQRRTVYRINVNSGGNPMLDALDCPLPSVKTPKRSSTTTSLQALSMMNNPFVDRMAKTLAARIGSEPSRVSRAYWLVLGRAPRPEEAASAEALIERAGLEAFSWALFNTSEFVYVE